jgi:DNA-binding transcriptional MerR regulator
MVDTKDLTKLYYSIGEVAEMFDVSPSLIRYWETEFSSLKPHKNSKGDRRFTKQNIEQLNTIYHLVKEKGFTLEGAKREIKEGKSDIKMKKELIAKLTSLRKQMDALRSDLNEEAG